MKEIETFLRETNLCACEASARDLTTFKGGGTLKYLLKPRNMAEFERILLLCNEFRIEPFVLGGGSNVIAMDGTVERIVVSTQSLDRIRIANDLVFAECGARIADIARVGREYGLGGLEFLAGVPLTVGGALKMNASAFGREISNFVESAFIFSSRACVSACEHNSQGELRDCGDLSVQRIATKDANFGYRKGVRGIVLGGVLRPERIDSAESKDLSKRFLAKRLAKQPRENSCGSVFKNGEIPSGKLIEDCGLKGRRAGGAKISEKHANFIVNTGGATAGDFLSLVELCEREVYERFGIKLEREFVLLE